MFLVEKVQKGLSVFDGDINSKEKAKKSWQMVKRAWTDSAIEDLNAIGESLVVLPEAMPTKKKKMYADISSLYFRGAINE